LDVQNVVLLRLGRLIGSGAGGRCVGDLLGAQGRLGGRRLLEAERGVASRAGALGRRLLLGKLHLNGELRQQVLDPHHMAPLCLEKAKSKR
jgi:hypothetical protein